MNSIRNERFTEIERLIRHGEAGRAREALSILMNERVDRTDRALLANFAWRAGMPEKGLHLLHSFVRPRAKSPVAATTLEKAEYAICLIKVGAGEEGALLLRNLDPNELPRVLLYRTASLVARWDYGASIPLLKRFLAMPGISSYDRIVAKVNLAAALVAEKIFPSGEYLLRELLHEVSLRGLKLAQGRVLELIAELHVARGKWQAADEFSHAAFAILAQSDGVDLFVVRKLRAIKSFLRREGSDTGYGQMERIKEEARARHHWETVRDCERIVAVRARAEDRINRLYFGTPFPWYRARLASETQGFHRLPASYLWTMGGGGKGSLVVVDLLSGEVTGGKAALKVGQANHRLLSVLVSDFYRPFRMAGLFAALFPDEKFNPIYSPARVRQATWRLRHWFQEAGVPLEIEEAEGSYRLVSRGNCAIRLTGAESEVSKESAPMKRLRQTFGETDFSIQQASAVLRLHPRTAQRSVRSAVDGGKVIRIGSGAKVRYRFQHDDSEAQPKRSGTTDR